MSHQPSAHQKESKHRFTKFASPAIPFHFGLGLDLTLGPLSALEVLLGSLT